MNVEWPVCGVNQRFSSRAIILVAFLHCACVPVCPVHRVFKYSQGKRMRQDSIVNCVSVLSVQVGVSEIKGNVKLY